MSDSHTAVWIDHHEAHVFRVEAETPAFTVELIHAPVHVPRHPQREAPAHNHPDDEKRFFADVAQALKSAGSVLVLGPSTAKLHFRDYVLAHGSTLKLTIAGVETVDHPSDKQVAAHVRDHFRSAAQAQIQSR